MRSTRSFYRLTASAREDTSENVRVSTLANKKTTHHEGTGERISGATAESVLSVAFLLPLTLGGGARLPARIAASAKIVPAETILHVTHEAYSCVDALTHEQRVLLQPGWVTAVHHKALGCRGFRGNMKHCVNKNKSKHHQTHIGRPKRRGAEGEAECARRNAGWHDVL